MDLFCLQTLSSEAARRGVLLVVVAGQSPTSFASADLLLKLVSLLLGASGTILGVIGFLRTRRIALTSTQIEVDQCLYRAYDLIGGREGTHRIREPVKARDQLERAKRELDKVLRLDARSSGAYRLLAAYYSALERPDDALEAAEHAVRLGASDPQAHNMLGVIRTLKGDYTEAASAYRQALALRPEYEQAWYNLGLVALRKGDLAEGERVLMKALAIDAEFADAHEAIGSIHLERARLEEAKAAFRSAAACDGQWPAPLNGLGRVAEVEGDLAMAERWYRQALGVKRTDRSAYLGLTRVLLRLGNLDAAKSVLAEGGEQASFVGHSPAAGVI